MPRPRPVAAGEVGRIIAVGVPQPLFSARAAVPGAAIPPRSWFRKTFTVAAGAVTEAQLVAVVLGAERPRVADAVHELMPRRLVPADLVGLLADTASRYPRAACGGGWPGPKAPAGPPKATRAALAVS